MADSEKQAKRSGVADLSGHQLGDYRILRRLGRGAMADVYLAEQQSLGRQVAIKVLKPELASDSGYVQRFQREARAAASLIHANIVQIHEVACIDGVHFIAQEYVQGVNLQQYLARSGTLDLRLALLVIRQTAAALAKAAEQKIVHRDIKPENIMLTKSAEVKVADFGLARVLQAEGSVKLTQVGMTMGTPLYMSPEQAEGSPLDHRSDIYSFGVTCYHMLAGHPPFTGETALSVAVQHLKKQAEPLENIRPDLPPALARIVHKMMAKSPDHRYQSARELVRDLRPLLQEHLDEDMGDDLPGLEPGSIDMMSSTLGQATQRLEAVMRSSREARSDWARRAVYAAVAFGAMAAGGWLARATVVEKPLLEGADVVNKRVEDMGSAYKQLIYALSQDTEESWLSVLHFYPNDEYCVSQARKKLALMYMSDIYVKNADDGKALEQLEKLALAGDSERQRRAFGLAGQYCVYSLRGDWEHADTALRNLLPIVEYLRDPVMQELYRRTIRGNRERLGQEKAAELLKAVPELEEETSPNAGGPAAPPSPAPN
ncbi:MAG: serine/threonine-protein kinase [Thermoguttaceae bacterium]|jgi:tRNA A-37 threonylcarbamoyl transferase component Bud32